jgi:hypothetical protein
MAGMETRPTDWGIMAGKETYPTGLDTAGGV